MDAGVKAVLLTMGFVALLAVVSVVAGWRRQRAEEALTREAQAGLPTRSHARESVAGAAAAESLVDPLMEVRVDQRQDVVAACDPPSPAATATHARRAS